MSEWLKTLVSYMLIVSISIQMLPSKKYEQQVRLFTGFLLLILVIQPILKIGAVDGYLESKISEFAAEQEKLEQEIGREGELFYEQSGLREEEKNFEVEIQKIKKIEVVIGD